MFRIAIITALLGASLPNLAWAFEITPVSQTLSPGGSGAKGAYEITNTGADPIAIEFFVAHLLKNLDGSEDLSQREENDFAVFPSHAVLAPGAMRTVRVQWLGDSQPEQELAFRFMAEEVPVNLDAPASDGKVHASLKFHYNFHGTLFVTPKGATPDIGVEALQLVRAEDGPRLVVRVQNTGTMRGWIRKFVLHVVVNGEPFDLTEQEVPALLNLPVLAGGHREVTLPWPANLPVEAPSAASIEVSY